jgi:NDP-4-keto-2,6-dideoxyhexose 3-C-methyltransferase
VWGVIEVASDRDSHKIGRKTPGTGIRIVSEEESRALKPDIYLVGPWHFQREIIDREHQFLAQGGELIFPLPRLHGAKQEDA